MAAIQENTINVWAAAPGPTERQKCENSERAIRKAIDASTVLRQKNIEVFAQGSYANRTNVSQDSDVDICVLYKSAFFSDFTHAPGFDLAKHGYSDGMYNYSDFKDDVHRAMVSYFGSAHVHRGNKAIDIRENTYRIDADVVACFEHRLWDAGGGGGYRSGTQLFPDNGGEVVNWPKQNYDNGVAKNDRTGQRFKAVTRVLKNLRYELIDDGHAVADRIPSFLVECLVWNVPDDQLRYGALTDGVRSAIAYLWNETRADQTCHEWTEVNNVKYLLRSGQPWTRQNINSFLQVCWNSFEFDE